MWLIGVWVLSQALTQMAIANDGKVMCPRTKEVFSLAEAERVYVM